MPIFMRVSGVPGESSDPRFPDSFEIQTFGFGITSAPSGAGQGGGGRADASDLVVTKTAEKGSTQLMLRCCNGTHITKVELTCTRPSDGAVYLEYTMEDCRITSYNVGGDEGSIPTETLSLNFEKIKYTQNVLFDDGSIREREEMAWDFRTNSGG